MSAYLITGYPGSGKSSVADELSRLGYKAYNTDDVPGLTAHYEIASGRKLDQAPPAPIDFTTHAWNWDIPALKKLLNQPGPVFAAGITSNTLDNLDLFDGIFYLDVDWPTLKHRLLNRSDNDFGKHPEELAELEKEDYTSNLHFWQSKGAVRIDASRPIAQVARDIIDHVEAKK